MTVEALLLTAGLVYPESPRWRDGWLWFSDVHDYAVKRVDLTGRVQTVVEVPGRPAGLGFLPDGRLLVAGALDRTVRVWDGRDLSIAVDLAPVAVGLLNDMVVDGVGRAYVGDTGFNMMAGDTPRAGQVILIRQASGGSFTASVVEQGVMFPNGAAMADDGRSYLVAESAANRVTGFSVAADGDLRGRRTFAELPSMPDGLCLDADGAVWVALLREQEFRRVDATGRVTDVVSAGGRLAVACTLGGPDRRTLFLCSAATTMDKLARAESVGLIHTIEVDVPGAGWP